MLGNEYACTMRKAHGRMCIMNSRCARSELRAPSDHSKRKRAFQVLTKASLLKTMYCLSVMENTAWSLYWLVVTRLFNAHSLVECSHVKTIYVLSAKGLGIDYSAKWRSICTPFKVFQGLLGTKLPWLLHMASFVSIQYI